MRHLFCSVFQAKQCLQACEPRIINSFNINWLLCFIVSFSRAKIKFIQFSDTSRNLTCNIWITPFFHPSNRYPFLSPLFPVDVGKEHRAKLHLTRARVLEKTGHLLFRFTSKEIFIRCALALEECQKDFTFRT